jgi:bacteriocin-like protein
MSCGKCGRTSDGRWLGWSKIMSNTRELTNDELNAVSGGADICKTTICVTFFPTDPGPGSGGGGGGGGGNAGPAIDAWNKCLGVFGY